MFIGFSVFRVVRKAAQKVSKKCQKEVILQFKNENVSDFIKI
jgi:hypothetical protein